MQIAAGAVIMLLAVVQVGRLRRAASSDVPYARIQLATLGFAAVFLAGYLLSIWVVIFGTEASLTALTGTVFMVGALFVAAVVFVGGRMIVELTATVRARDYLDDLFRSMGDGVLVVDAAMTITDTNEAATRLTGYEHGELSGVSLDSLVHGEGGQLPQGGSRWWATSGVRSVQVGVTRKDGTEFPVVMSSSVIRGGPDDQGDPRGMV